VHHSAIAPRTGAGDAPRPPEAKYHGAGGKPIALRSINQSGEFFENSGDRDATPPSIGDRCGAASTITRIDGRRLGKV
jgi:hypothetical protein